jgi:hypothetical protein
MKSLNYHIYLNIRYEFFSYSSPEKWGGFLIITYKVAHILSTYFPDNCGLWAGLSYIQVALYLGKYSSHTDSTTVVTAANETWADPPCCQLYTANGTCYKLRQDETIMNRQQWTEAILWTAFPIYFHSQLRKMQQAQLTGPAGFHKSCNKTSISSGGTVNILCGNWMFNNNNKAIYEST